MLTSHFKTSVPELAEVEVGRQARHRPRVRKLAAGLVAAEACMIWVASHGMWCLLITGLQQTIGLGAVSNS